MTTKTEMAAAIARAVDLLEGGLPPAAVVRLLRHECSVSRATAHRYVAQAVTKAKHDPDMDPDLDSAAEAIGIAHEQMMRAMLAGDVDAALKWGRLHEMQRRRNGMKISAK